MTPRSRAWSGEPDPAVMSVVEAARLLGISKTLAYGLVARQELPSLRLGGRVRIPRRAIERLAEGRRKAGPDAAQPVGSSARRAARVSGPASEPSPDGAPSARSRPRSNRRDHHPRSTTQLSLFDVPPSRPTAIHTIPTSPPPAQTTTAPDPSCALPSSPQEHDTSAPGVRQRGAGSR